jgi:hypothetical protein
MKENVGRMDRFLRMVAGPALLYMGYNRLNAKRGRGAGLAALVAGTLISGTAVTKTCPFNALFGVDTSHRKAA